MLLFFPPVLFQLLFPVFYSWLFSYLWLMLFRWSSVCFGWHHVIQLWLHFATHVVLAMIYPSCSFYLFIFSHKCFPLATFHTIIAFETAGDPFSLLTNTECSVLADKLIPIIFKYSGSGGGSGSSLFSIMLSALNIVYSIYSGAGRRLLWSVLIFQAIYFWYCSIFLRHRYFHTVVLLVLHHP